MGAAKKVRTAILVLMFIIGLLIIGARLPSSSSEVAYAQLTGATAAFQQQQQQQQTPSPSPPQQSQSQQQGPQQSQPQPQRMAQTYTVSIDYPFSQSRPNSEVTVSPLKIKVGDTVVWQNKGSDPHTVTSGQNGQPDGKFDSSTMTPGARFSHTFTEAGEYPYFCLLHPNMVGIVMVTAAGSGSESSSIGSNPTTASPIGDNDAASGLLSGLTDPLQDLLGSGDQTAGSSGSSSGTSPGSSTSSSSSSPSSSGGSRCPDGFHRSPSGDCERVRDTRGMPRCPDGYHRSPSGNCEYVG